MIAIVPSERSSRTTVLSWPMRKTRIRALTASLRRSVATGHGARSCSQSPPRTMHSARSSCVVDRLRDPRGVGDESHRPQDHRHEQEDADVVDAGLAANRRSWGALWGHPGTFARIV